MYDYFKKVILHQWENNIKVPYGLRNLVWEVFKDENINWRDKQVPEVMVSGAIKWVWSLMDPEVTKGMEW